MRWGLRLSSQYLAWFGLRVLVVGYHWGAIEFFLRFLLPTQSSVLTPQGISLLAPSISADFDAQW